MTLSKFLKEVFLKPEPKTREDAVADVDPMRERLEKLAKKHQAFCWSCGVPRVEPYKFYTCVVNGHLGTCLICDTCLEIKGFDVLNNGKGV